MVDLLADGGKKPWYSRFWVIVIAVSIFSPLVTAAVYPALRGWTYPVLIALGVGGLVWRILVLRNRTAPFR
ncbi:MAG TPA: hypothetical protein VND44_12080 [Acidimicrobiales bacterium]|nr:hypothetical protein [Acidimicrobiales bacterium]